MTQAAVREVYEEVGLTISKDALIPFFLSSIVPMNQFYISFRAHLDTPLEPQCGNEASEAAWFGRKDFPAKDYWMSDLASTMSEVYDCVESGKYNLYLADVTESRFSSRTFSFDGKPRR